MRFRYVLLTLMVPAMLCCNKPQPEPEPQPEPQPEKKDPVTATITADDVTVEEGQTVQITASTNSSAAISYTASDPEIATVSAAGLVTGVKAGNATVILKVEAVADKFTAAEKTVYVTVTAVETPPEEDPYADAAPEVKNGDTVLACNADVEKFLTDVHYPNHNYTYTELNTWAQANGVAVCPGKSDKPSEYSIRWAVNATTEEVTVTVSEPTRDWVYTQSNSEIPYVEISNLLPNTHYTYKAVAGGNVLTEGEFDTYGKVHQLFFKSLVRNSRDLGGWKTEDGKTVKYRKVYRGGRLEPSYLSKGGVKAIQTEGIKAQLDLRSQEDVLYESTFKNKKIWKEGEYAFCAPLVREGYSHMLQDYTIEMDYAWFIEKIDDDTSTDSSEDVKAVTIAEFKAAPESDSQVYEIVGKVGASIKTTFGYFTLTDDSGSVYVYGLTATNLGYGAQNDRSFASLGLKKDDKIKIRGYRGVYNAKEKTRQCMQFIMDCVDKDMPVYFHCSLGRDRTGTVAMLTLGILGVPEGDISQEYELTQFAPHGYATSEGENTKMTRLADYDSAANVIWGYAGGGFFQDGVNAYLLEIGISQDDIDKFKANMLQ